MLDLKEEVADSVGDFDLDRDDDGGYPRWKFCGTGTPGLPADASAWTDPPVIMIETDGDGDDPNRQHVCRVSLILILETCGGG